MIQCRLSWWKMLIRWFVALWGDLAGSMLIVSIIFGSRLNDLIYASTCRTSWSGDHFLLTITIIIRWKCLLRWPFQQRSYCFATRNQVIPDFYMVFLRGIGCNWLVCLVCYFGVQGRDLTSKIISIWWPIFAFVSLGYDQVVVNMMFVPMAIWVDAPAITVGLYIWKGVMPTLVGNIIGEGLFCGRSFLQSTASCWTLSD